MARASVYVTYKKGVLDPQGETIKGALGSLGFARVRSARVGKYIELELDDAPREDIRTEIEKMCRELLANPVIEDFRIEFSEDEASNAPPEARE
ncbi:MAG: phosphoribosylformylglycinamidine synthase subunit PurS [bacterium]|nr:phosphoribosylformylglycinamidine synthase subunit PurS [bacterium]